MLTLSASIPRDVYKLNYYIDLMYENKKNMTKKSFHSFSNDFQIGNGPLLVIFFIYKVSKKYQQISI